MEGMQSHIQNTLHVHMRRLYSTIYSYGLANRSCVSSWCTHLRHMEEKCNPFWLNLKFIENQSSSISEMQLHACIHIHLSLPYTLKNTHAYFPRAYPCLCSVLPVDGGLYGPWGKGLRAPKCCFSPHYCQSIHWWLMMDYISASAQGFPSVCDLQQLGALAALAATLTMASTAQGISHRTFSLLFSSCWLGSCFTGDAQGEMSHVPLFKGCFGYIRDFFFICCRPKPCLHLSFSVNGNALTAIWSSATQGGCGAGLWFTATHKPTILML